MQALAFECNLSETTFVLPPADAANSARVRIFNRTAEMSFAGHPTIGTAYVLARAGHPDGDLLRLEVPAGVVSVEIERADGEICGGKITAPQPLSMGRSFPAPMIAACVGLTPDDVVVDAHAPTLASVGNTYVIAEVAAQALAHCVPSLEGFRAAFDGGPDLAGRFSLYVYSQDGANVRARMFAPLAGTWEDPATGSAATPLAGLLLSVRGGEALEFDVRQGEEMGRPSLLRVSARRGEAGIITTVAGSCVPMFRGETQ